MQSMENPEINNYASLSIVSEASINGAFPRFAKNRGELVEMQSGAAIHLIFPRLQITVKGLQTLQGRDTMEHEITQDVLGVLN